MKPLQSTLLCHYRYDALDRLTDHTKSDDSPLQRFYCKSRLSTEVQGAIKQSIVQHGDLLLAQQRFEGGALQTSLMTTDQQRSVMQTFKADQPSQLAAYSPYGHRSRENGLLSLLGFNGERPEPVTGHYLLGNGYRAFNPVLMRFNSPDSLSPFGKGGLNAYTYCLGDPTNNYDPDGHRTLGLTTVLKLRILAKKASVNVLKENGTIDLYRGPGVNVTAKPRPGITAENAVNQRSRLEKLSTLGSNGHAQNQKFSKDLKQAKLSDQTIPENKATLDVLSSAQTEQPGQLANSLWSDTFDQRKLFDRPPAETRLAGSTRTYYLQEMFSNITRTAEQNRYAARAELIDETYFIRTTK